MIPSKTIDQRHLFDLFTMNPDGSGEKLVVRQIVERVDWGSIPTGAPNPVPPPPVKVLGHPALTLRCVRGDLSALVAPPAGIDFVQFYLNGIDLQGGNPHFFNSPPFTTSYPASRLHAAGLDRQGSRLARDRELEHQAGSDEAPRAPLLTARE